MNDTMSEIEFHTDEAYTDELNAALETNGSKRLAGKITTMVDNMTENTGHTYDVTLNVGTGDEGDRLTSLRAKPKEGTEYYVEGENTTGHVFAMLGPRGGARRLEIRDGFSGWESDYSEKTSGMWRLFLDKLTRLDSPKEDINDVETVEDDEDEEEEDNDDDVNKEMYVEEFDDGSWYVRLTKESYSKIKGKRVLGHGKITGYTNAEGEMHPAVIKTEDGSRFTPTELSYEGFDARHNGVEFDVPEGPAEEEEETVEDDEQELEEGDKLRHNDGTERYVHEILEGFGSKTIKLGVKSDEGNIMATTHGKDRIKDENADEWEVVDENGDDKLMTDGGKDVIDDGEEIEDNTVNFNMMGCIGIDVNDTMTTQDETQTEIVRDGFTLDKAAMSAASLESHANDEHSTYTEKGDKMAIEFLSASSGYESTTVAEGRIVRFHRNKVEMLRNDGATMTVETGEFMSSALTVRTNGRKVGTIQGDYDGTGISLLRDNYEQVPVEDEDEENELVTDGGEEMGEEETELDAPIKVRFTGKLRRKLDERSVEYDGEEWDDIDRALSRQKTNVVVETVEEAENLISKLSGYESGRTWMTGSMNKCATRVRQEIESGLENDEEKLIPDGGQENAEEVTDEFAEGEKYSNEVGTVEIIDVEKSGRRIYFDDGGYERRTHRDNLKEKLNNRGFTKVEDDDEKEIMTDGGMPPGETDFRHGPPEEEDQEDE